MASKECLVVLCGIPGAGKSSLVDQFLDYLKKICISTGCATNESNPGTMVHPIILCYDDLIPNNLPLEIKSVSSENLWKRRRQDVSMVVDNLLSCLSKSKVYRTRGYEMADEASAKVQEQLLTVLRRKCACLISIRESDPKQQEILHLFIIDDNMFYRSMRYSYYRLARQYSTGFCQVFVNCDLSIAYQRNSERSAKVSEESLARVADKFQVPNGANFPWELSTFEVNSNQVITDLTLHNLYEFIMNAFKNPAPPLQEEDDEAKRLAQLVTSRNIIHQADQILRSRIAQQVKELQHSTESGSTSVKDLATIMNKKRKSFLERLKSDETLKRCLADRIDETMNTTDNNPVDDESQESVDVTVNKLVLQEVVIAMYTEFSDNH